MHEQKTMGGGIPDGSKVQLPTYDSLWIYILGPLVGGIIAGLLSKLNEIARAASGLSSVDDTVVMEADYNNISDNY